MYYYSHKSDVRPKGVIFLTGSIIERVSTYVRTCAPLHECYTSDLWHISSDDFFYFSSHNHLFQSSSVISYCTLTIQYLLSHHFIPISPSHPMPPKWRMSTCTYVCCFQVKDEASAMKGYFGFELLHQDLCTGEHHRCDSVTPFAIHLLQFFYVPKNSFSLPIIITFPLITTYMLSVDPSTSICRLCHASYDSLINWHTHQPLTLSLPRSLPPFLPHSFH